MSKESLKTLKMLLKGTYPYSNENDPLEEQLQYLKKLGYAELLQDITKYGETLNPRFKITESGKAYLSNRTQHLKEIWIPYAITTIISILALMKSYGFGIDDIITWYTQQPKQ